MKRTMTKLACAAVACMLAGAAAGQAVVPSDKSILYYKIGGGEPVKDQPFERRAHRRAADGQFLGKVFLL